jgi:hypothetical protein
VNYVTKARFVYLAVLVCLALPFVLATIAVLPDGPSDGAEI